RTAGQQRRASPAAPRVGDHMRFALAVLLVTGCATTTPVLSEAPGIKRLPTAGIGTPSHHMHSAKHRSRRHRPVTSRSLYRLPWDSRLFNRLAQCESGGNPRAVDPTGTYFGLYQFTLTTWAS